MVEQTVCMKHLRAAAPHRAQYKMELGAQLARRPQPSGWACTSGPSGREIAALRPGAAAGCRSLCDRYRQTISPQAATAGAHAGAMKNEK